MPAKVTWKGDEVMEINRLAAKDALNELGGRWEAAAKGSLRPGRGLVTGTYRRSLHSANANYNFAGDDVHPSESSPDRSGKGGGAQRYGLSVRIMVGSGMKYARRLERLYSVVAGGMNAVKGLLPGIFQRYVKARGLQ